MQVIPNIDNPHNHRFPGSLPVGLERSKIKTLQKGDYWVSEKSDGLRYFFVFIHTLTTFVQQNDITRSL